MSPLLTNIRKVWQAALEQSYKHVIFISRQLRHCHSIYNNSKEVEHWISTQDDETRVKIEQIQKQIVKQAKYHTSSNAIELNASKYQYLLNSTSNGRKNFINFLLNLENRREEQKVEREVRRTNYEHLCTQSLNCSESKHIRYGLGHNSLLQRFERQWMLKWNCQKMATAIHSKEPEIIYDCSFNHTMSPFELRSAANQLKFSFMANARSAQPFVVHLYNVGKNSPFRQLLHQRIPYLDKLPVFIHEHDITEAISPERLVYLSPNSEHILEEYNPQDCYVIGCIVDRGPKPPLTLTKATELKIRTARLPIDKFVTFYSYKTLALDQVTRILLTARQSSNWQREIIGSIPDFKYETDDDEEFEQK